MVSKKRVSKESYAHIDVQLQEIQSKVEGFFTKINEKKSEITVESVSAELSKLKGEIDSRFNALLASIKLINASNSDASDLTQFRTFKKSVEEKLALLSKEVSSYKAPIESLGVAVEDIKPRLKKVETPKIEVVENFSSEFAQRNHGFEVLDCINYDSATNKFVKSEAGKASAVVSKVLDVDRFEVVKCGSIHTDKFKMGVGYHISNSERGQLIRDSETYSPNYVYQYVGRLVSPNDFFVNLGVANTISEPANNSAEQQASFTSESLSDSLYVDEDGKLSICPAFLDKVIYPILKSIEALKAKKQKDSVKEETAESIISKLSSVDGASRLSAKSIKDLPSPKDEETGESIAAKLNSLKTGESIDARQIKGVSQAIENRITEAVEHSEESILKNVPKQPSFYMDSPKDGERLFDMQTSGNKVSFVTKSLQVEEPLTLKSDKDGVVTLGIKEKVQQKIYTSFAQISPSQAIGERNSAFLSSFNGVSAIEFQAGIDSAISFAAPLRQCDIKAFLFLSSDNKDTSLWKLSVLDISSNKELSSQEFAWNSQGSNEINPTFVELKTQFGLYKLNLKRLGAKDSSKSSVKLLFIELYS